MVQRSLSQFGYFAAAMMCGVALPAVAQVQLEEIVVTARKREERLQEIPIAITAFTADQLQRAGFKDLHELTLNVAGVQYHSLGLAIPGRVNPSIRFRGMDVNTQSPTFQLATLFIDGIFVQANVDSIPFDDIERVEVVKGPQAAYFGRATFGGAVNYIMKTPSTKEFSGEVKASGATYDEYDVSANIDGPIIQDKIGVRLGGRLYNKGAMYRASDGGGLGEESSKSIQATIYVTPTDNLSAKIRVFRASDSDGPAAGGYIAGRNNDTCTGKTITTKAGETARPVRFICGQVPKQGQALNALGGLQIIDSNTTARSPQAFLSTGDPNFLLTNLIQKPYNPSIHVPKLNGIGLERRLFRMSGQIEYEFDGGITATAQGGYNTQEANWVRDYTFTPRDNAYSRDPQDMNDHSLEARIASPQNQKLRWLGGVNLYKQHLITSGSGGDALYLCNDSVVGLAFGACVQSPNILLNYSSFDNALGLTDNVRTLGFYGSAAYDFTQELTLNLEGRYQKDRYVRGLIVKTTVDSKKFLPRVILQYKPTPATNIYASFAKGVIQPEINQAVIDNDATARAQFTAQGVFAFTPLEQLDSYELGWKQQFLDNRVSINTAAYYGVWTGKKARQIVNILYNCGTGTGAPNGSTGCRPALGEAGPGQPARLANGQPSFRAANATISGDSKIWGFELEGNAALTESWTAGWTFDYARNRFTNFFANASLPVAGFTNMKGNSHARFPKFSGSVNSAYTGKLTDTWDWFVRGDVSYFGKTFVEVDNLATCDSYLLANARAGVEKEAFRLEFFVKNLFNDKNWAACSRFSEFDLPLDLSNLTQYQGVIVAPQNKRQFGLKTVIKF